MPEAVVQKLKGRVFETFVQISLLELATLEPPDSIEDIEGLGPWKLKNVPALKEAHAQHRHESRAATDGIPAM